MMIYLFLAEGFEELEATVALDILRRARLPVKAVGIGGRLITGSHGITLQADADDSLPLGKFDMIVLPGGMPGAENLRSSPFVMDAVKRSLEQGSWIGAICAAPGVVLAGTGALAGKKYAGFPGFAPPEGEYTSSKLERDGRLITARAPEAAVIFAIALVEAFLPERAEELRKTFFS